MASPMPGMMTFSQQIKAGNDFKLQAKQMEQDDSYSPLPVNDKSRRLEEDVKV